MWDSDLTQDILESEVRGGTESEGGEGESVCEGWRERERESEGWRERESVRDGEGGRDGGTEREGWREGDGRRVRGKSLTLCMPMTH